MAFRAHLRLFDLCPTCVCVQATPTAQELKFYIRAQQSDGGEPVAPELGTDGEPISRVRLHNNVAESRVFLHPSSFNFNEVSARAFTVVYCFESSKTARREATTRLGWCTTSWFTHRRYGIVVPTLPQRFSGDLRLEEFVIDFELLHLCFGSCSSETARWCRTTPCFCSAVATLLLTIPLYVPFSCGSVICVSSCVASRL